MSDFKTSAYIWLSQNFVIPLHPMMSHKNGWWLVIGCSFKQFIAEQGD